MRSKKTPAKKIQLDPVYGSPLIAKLITSVMQDGRKSVAAKQVYKAIDIVAEQTKQDGVEYLHASLDNIKPTIEVRSRRVGGASYQVPTPIRPERRDSLAIRWLINAAKARGANPYRTLADKLAAEIVEAHENAGAAIKKKLDTHKMAEANKAFAHFRW
ncbi:30S ribosomal protein S7 [Candidatus Collierbacteria bacterium RIFOXYB2_FULL_46_14]|uniref:Small ribosomal subunit protein uS7 n=1 Tax=Candidatus Collierbacteria bacterium GW2011_GWA2_46_26 TaxID=1618381 RepID=A0A0G1SHP6_9BACT|nr:MAG: 30S ribosomal protein S7 [Candidatus Collierbacteria bacterium GW2011_GWC2_44_13]KKU32850.1 MAG: 30S ribosomal protein S7 [Candidatus Collierbacteria bacterium GW2011_GWA2_46_26]OGD72830.1 MAG: 30S ribosomal protein S7 [Candidatus Collierbacteria bacterium RIFOXYB2_FULL_46_14]OGD75872.1 MAG: 30S ribosomal protein S7 [Candidatus Collierbacteria bacterium RIFOXYA2_FULL_46_20]OGD77208.1 MAG: 30S ribosomal protein S7 [Candidatus Collierbacteria bacterium RIFOXYC2_FULL_43_15]OGD80498.1 MAG: